MKKTTKEYAEKLAKEWYAPKQCPEDKYREYAQHDFTQGYMKAIEENAVPELIEVLNSLQVRLNACMNVGDIDVTEAYDSFYQNIVSEALKKATKI